MVIMAWTMARIRARAIRAREMARIRPRAMAMIRAMARIRARAMDRAMQCLCGHGVLEFACISCTGCYTSKDGIIDGTNFSGFKPRDLVGAAFNI